jgi:5'-3' exonuclease
MPRDGQEGCHGPKVRLGEELSIPGAVGSVTAGWESGEALGEPSPAQIQVKAGGGAREVSASRLARFSAGSMQPSLGHVPTLGNEPSLTSGNRTETGRCRRAVRIQGRGFPRGLPCRIVPLVIVHLVDGTYELFRHFYAPAATIDRNTPEALRAVRGVVASLVGMLEGGATHLGVATDHVIESFRNALWPGYKTGEGVDPVLFAQFEPLEDALRALGLVVWPMVEFEADDALAAAATMAAADARVQQVVICTPDKDLAQCVRGDRIVQLDRRTREVRDETAVRRKFGVPPASIPDWLALVGDSADGYPGLPGWGARSAATVLACYAHLEQIPRLATEWRVSLRGAERLATTLTERRDRALLFRELATLRSDTPIGVDVDVLCWREPRAEFAGWSERLGDSPLHDRVFRLAAARAAGAR